MKEMILLRKSTVTLAALVAATVTLPFLPSLNAQTNLGGRLYTGRSPYSSRTEKPVTLTPAPATKTAAKGGGSEVTSGSVRLRLNLPAEVAVGEEFTAELRLSVTGTMSNVVVQLAPPAQANQVRSEPAAAVEGGNLSWKLGPLDAGQSRVFKITFKTETEGQASFSAMVGETRVSASNFAGKPVINITQSGPETAVLGQDVTYNLVVKNSGTAALKGVAVINPIPTSMSHSSGKGELTFDVGDLAPGQSKPLSVTLKANQRGKVCVAASATSSNAGKVGATNCTVVLVPGLKVEQTGTKEQIMGRNADYEIVVSNPGDTALQNVTVSDLVPAETSIVAAPSATISGSKATWVIASLAPGAKATQTIKLTARVAGTHCNNVTASSGSVTDSGKACTLWRGIAGVALDVADDPDPIQIGETTTYTIKVTNQGFADIHNIKITAVYGEQVTPMSAVQGSITDKTVTFPVVATLGTKQSVTYQITVKGTSVGDSRNRITLTADELKTPVLEEESTTIY